MKTVSTLLIGTFIRGLREGAGATQIGLAHSLGINQSMLTRIESGKFGISLVVAHRIMKRFGLTLNDLTKFLGVDKDEYKKFKRNKSLVTDTFNQNEEMKQLLEAVEANPTITKEQRLKIKSILNRDE